MIAHDSPGVISTNTTLQGVVSRLAGNSSSCKTWCIGLVTAVLLVGTDRQAGVELAVLPIVVFALLDAYYLAMEKSARDCYNAFIARVHDGAVEVSDLYRVSVTVDVGSTLRAARSFSVWPFYALLMAMAWAVTRFV